MKVGVLVRRNSRNVDGVIQAANIANRLQSEFEFDVEQVDWLQKGNSGLRPEAVVKRVKGKHAGRQLIVVISPPLKGDYLDYARRGMNIVSTAGWDSRFAPPPLAIYVLFQFADAVASFVADLSPRQVHRRMRHNGFRACIFNSTEGRRRLLSVLIAGYVCADCRARLREWGVSATQLDAIGHLLSYVRDFTIDKPRYLPNAVFIGHGRRADWEKVSNGVQKIVQTVVETPTYLAIANKLFSEEERADIVALVAADPECGEVIRGTGGFRKVRVARKGMGKSGGARVVYIWRNERFPVFLITVFPKNEKENLSMAERNTLRKRADSIFETYREVA
jgi:hypothetical protein